MKYNWLLILIIFIMVSAFKFGTAYEFDNPSIKIESKSSMPAQAGNIAVYSILVSSTQPLVNVKVTPSLLGMNADSKIDFTFENNIHKARISYIYVIPENLDGISEISFTISLTDVLQTKLKTETLSVASK